MTLHLIKLCVGVEEPDELVKWQAMRRQQKREAGLPDVIAHITRMVPKRADELLDGGSLYWVMKGSIRCRQRLLDVETFTDEEGIRRCRLVLDPEVVQTELRARRPFQGWRYLKVEDAPEDISGEGEAGDMPPEMRAELRALGLL